MDDRRIVNIRVPWGWCGDFVAGLRGEAEQQDVSLVLHKHADWNLFATHYDIELIPGPRHLSGGERAVQRVCHWIARYTQEHNRR